MTVISAVALADPEMAVIVSVPLVTAVTSPAAETVATPAADVDHDTLAPFIGAPFWSFTIAVSCCAAPVIDEKLRSRGDSVIDVATGARGFVGVVGEVAPSPPPQDKTSSASARRKYFILLILGYFSRLGQY